ncbi:hypothetical protein Pla123a_00670 [Posidoniimonas polymericola]|uniref:Uncharacterized protein n=1 Tax=Posidoniimonas polymericola TaxID=2528002 RepID=A0A5C5ZDM6_9BACT|nr:hypothetical protein [Posidoniimonas polymericola]TWT85260.1 hypothetical protein Pla123a_00670 [Posidoniimonas polymericola]
MDQHSPNDRFAGQPANISGIRCSVCSNQLNAAAPTENRRVVLRACASCEARYYTADLPGALSGAPHVGLASPASLPTHEHRRLRRLISVLVAAGELAHGLALPVTATPLDERYVPVGQTVAGVVSDLTEQWIRVTLPTDRHASYWLLDFGPSGHAGCQVAVRCETASPVGDGSWRVAGAPAS